MKGHVGDGACIRGSLGSGMQYLSRVCMSLCIHIRLNMQASAPGVRWLRDGLGFTWVLVIIVTQLESLILAQNERWRHA